MTTRRVWFDSSLGRGKTTYDERSTTNDFRGSHLHEATTLQSTPADAWTFVWFAREIHIARAEPSLTLHVELLGKIGVRA